MTLDVEGEPHRSAHQEILEEEQAKADHVIDVLPTCHRIMTLAQEVIDIGDFSEGTFGKIIVDVILTEARTTL